MSDRNQFHFDGEEPPPQPRSRPPQQRQPQSPPTQRQSQSMQRQPQSQQREAQSQQRQSKSLPRQGQPPERQPQPKQSHPQQRPPPPQHPDQHAPSQRPDFDNEGPAPPAEKNEPHARHVDRAPRDHTGGRNGPPAPASGTTASKQNTLNNTRNMRKPQQTDVAVAQRSLSVPIAEVVRNHHERLALLEEKVYCRDGLDLKSNVDEEVKEEIKKKKYGFFRRKRNVKKDTGEVVEVEELIEGNDGRYDDDISLEIMESQITREEVLRMFGAQSSTFKDLLREQRRAYDGALMNVMNELLAALQDSEAGINGERLNSLETRIANLELEMENIKAQLEALRAPSSTIFEKISGRKKDAELENTESVKDKERGSVLGWFGKGRDSPNSEESEEGIFERIFGGKKEESKEEQEKLKPTKKTGKNATPPSSSDDGILSEAMDFVEEELSLSHSSDESPEPIAAPIIRSTSMKPLKQQAPPMNSRNRTMPPQGHQKQGYSDPRGPPGPSSPGPVVRSRDVSSERGPPDQRGNSRGRDGSVGRDQRRPESLNRNQRGRIGSTKARDASRGRDGSRPRDASLGRSGTNRRV